MSERSLVGKVGNNKRKKNGEREKWKKQKEEIKREGKRKSWIKGEFVCAPFPIPGPFNSRTGRTVRKKDLFFKHVQLWRKGHDMPKC